MSKMTIQEFEKEYCKDLIKTNQTKEYIMSSIDFTYDEIITDENGNQVKIIKVGDYEIPIEDLFWYNETDFQHRYPSKECLEARERYLENFVLLEGEAVLREVRDKLRACQDRIDKYADLNFEEFL